ncbi:hypothetical protein ACFVS2_20810 [Brevibacillus sp. NPDC058079]|uniref:hypothetical protein n=1 Tax=Brevibacillus sp. NPDC058079 TaxID=3346330 RepID=UPI0036EF01FC
MNISEYDVETNEEALLVDKRRYRSLEKELERTREAHREENIEGREWRICDHVLTMMEAIQIDLSEQEKLLETKLKALPMNYSQAKDIQDFLDKGFGLKVKLVCTPEEAYELNRNFFCSARSKNK